MVQINRSLEIVCDMGRQMFKKYAVAMIALSACGTQENTEITTADPAQELLESTETLNDADTSPEPAVDPCLPVEGEVWSASRSTTSEPRNFPKSDNANFG